MSTDDTASSERPEPSGLVRLAPLLPLRPVDPDELARARERIAARERERHAAERRADLTRRADACGVPRDDLLRAVALDDSPRPTPALELVRAAATWRRGREVTQATILAGPPGTGKTCAAAWQLLRRGSGGLWISARAIDLTPRNGFSTSVEWWRRVESARTLVLDDLGCEHSDPDEVAQLLCDRAGLWTICTTNLAWTDFRDRYLRGPAGLRLSDRLRGQWAQGSRAWGDTGRQSLRGAP